MNRNGKASLKMAENILTRISASALHRVDVSFNIKSTSVNSIIGREAHLQLLESESLLKMLVYRYAHLFC